jgi:molecular chaperone IbpA
MEGVGVALLNSSRSDTHPPYNVVKGENGHTTVEVAVAGYDPERVRVVVTGKTLTVSCGAETDTREYAVRGMTRRPWVKHWTLGEWTRVEGARLRNGVLEVELVTAPPQSAAPQEIPVARS